MHSQLFAAAGDKKFMKKRKTGWFCLQVLLASLCVPAYATVAISSLTPSAKSPHAIGTTITWTAIATDSDAGPLTFQFNVALPKGALALVQDFNVGTSNAGTWTSQPFVWTPTGIEGIYQIEVVIKDFKSGETATKTVKYEVTPLVTGSAPVVVATANPLVALFSAPSCAVGSTMRVSFQEQSKAKPATVTYWAKCHPPHTMTFEIAGMYPKTTYQMLSQTLTAGKITNGTILNFTTGALPTSIVFPAFKVIVPAGAQADTTAPIILHDVVQFVGGSEPDVATDLAGNILWYYFVNGNSPLITRPLLDGSMLTLQYGPAWNPASQKDQLLCQIDLAGNITRETNIGVIQQQLLAMGVTDAQACNSLPSPAPLGAACLGAFHHDAIQTLPNGYTAALVDIEKIFAPGTQGDTSGLPVDIIGDMIIVLNANWQVVWYWDSFEHAGGPPQLDVSQPAPLGGTCIANEPGCPPVFLLTAGIAPEAKDWLHGNSLYYWATDTVGGASNDIVFSARNQDLVMKIDYNNGSGTGNILWRMGPCGEFTFNNIYNDPWPWFSAQHEVGIENNGAGPMSLFDNGNTRVSRPSGPGSSTGCLPGVGSGDSRGMVLTIDETTLQVTPVLSVDMGVFSTALGSAQLLSDSNYFFLAGEVPVSLNTVDSYSIEILPTPGTATGTQVLNLQGPQHYRGWQMPSLYSPPPS
jgi:arylsulfate sulfotransferase